mgnify:CR=1 FL=1
MGNCDQARRSRRGLIGHLRAVVSGIALLVISATTGIAGECQSDEVLLRGERGEVRFSVEVADEPQERAKGLMFRESMPQSMGMLFIYPKPQPVAFWMKNTLISLDVIFLDKTGTVVRVHERAKPLDETPIFGGDEVFAVLEVNAGLAGRFGIGPGSELRHPAFGEDAAWPC